MTGTTSANPLLREFLGSIRPHLPLRESADILMELETAVLDRADDLARSDGSEPTDAHVQRAIAEIGSPDEVAAAYSESRYLVEPAAYRGFLLRACMVFVIHMVLIGVVTAIQRSFHVGLFSIDPVGPNGVLSVLAAAVHAGLIDLGLMTAFYAIVGGFRGHELRSESSFAVDVRPRHAAARATLALLVALVLNVFRDGLFFVVSRGETHPLFTSWTTEILPLLTLLLFGAAVKDLCYVFAGERRSTVGLDALHGFVGVILMLYLLGGQELMEVPPLEGLESFLEPVNRFLAQLGSLVLAVAAVLFGAKTLRRAIRVAQI